MKKGGCSCEAEMWYGACVALALTGRVADALAPRSGEDGWRRRTQRRMREANRPTVWRRRTIWSLCSRKECHHPHWIFWHLPKQRHKREGAWCLSLDLSHLCTHSTHIITHLLSACHPAGSRSSWRSISVCHVVSLLLCNFLFFFFPLLFPGKNVPPVPLPVTVGGQNNPFQCLTQLQTLRGAWRIPRIPAFAPTTVTLPEGMPYRSYQTLPVHTHGLSSRSFIFRCQNFRSGVKRK